MSIDQTHDTELKIRSIYKKNNVNKMYDQNANNLVKSG